MKPRFKWVNPHPCNCYFMGTDNGVYRCGRNDDNTRTLSDGLKEKSICDLVIARRCQFWQQW